MVEMCTRLAIERARRVTLHLQQARRSSIPTSAHFRNALIGKIGSPVTICQAQAAMAPAGLHF